MEKIWLASKSPRRAELLTRLGLEYEILTAEVDETVDGEPYACVETLAKRKADAGAEKAGAGWVLAADTLVFLDGKALGKPEDEQDAKRMLRALAGKTHQVLTGMCLKNAATGESFVRHDGARVTFDEMTEDEIEDYISTDEPYDKAGGYAVQGRAALYIAGVTGDFYTVVGLPIHLVRTMLRDEFGVDIRDIEE